MQITAEQLQLALTLTAPTRASSGMNVRAILQNTIIAYRNDGYLSIYGTNGYSGTEVRIAVDTDEAPFAYGVDPELLADALGSFDSTDFVTITSEFCATATVAFVTTVPGERRDSEPLPMIAFIDRLKPYVDMGKAIAPPVSLSMVMKELLWMLPKANTKGGEVIMSFIPMDDNITQVRAEPWLRKSAADLLKHCPADYGVKVVNSTTVEFVKQTYDADYLRGLLSNSKLLTSKVQITIAPNGLFTMIAGIKEVVGKGKNKQERAREDITYQTFLMSRRAKDQS